MKVLLSRIRSNYFHWGIFFIILFHLIANFVWLRLNHAPPTWDSAGHLVLANIFAQIFRGAFGFVRLVDFLRVSNYYPPLLHLLGGGVFLLLGNNTLYPLFLNTLFFILAIAYLYKLALKFNNKNYRYAFQVSLLFSLFPGVWEQSRQFHLDIPLTALVLGTVYHLHKSNNFLNGYHSLLFFVFLSMSQLTKWYAFIYIIVPFFYFLISVWKFKSFFDERFIMNLFVGGSIVVMLISPWYLENSRHIFEVSKITLTGELGDPPIFSLTNFFYYPKLIVSQQITFIPSAMLIIGGGILAIKQKSRSVVISLFSIFIPLAVFTCIENKDMRYILPITPLFSISVVSVIDSWKSKWMGKLIFGLLILLLGSAYLVLSFGKQQNRSKFTAYSLGGPYYSYWQKYPNSYTYDSNNWRLSDVQKLVAQLTNKYPGNKKVLVLVEQRNFSVSAFQLESLMSDRINYSVHSPQYKLTVFTEPELRRYLSAFDVVVLSNSPGPIGLRNYAVLRQLSIYVEQKDSGFSLVKSFILPDKNEVNVFEKTENR